MQYRPDTGLGLSQIPSISCRPFCCKLGLPSHVLASTAGGVTLWTVFGVGSRSSMQASGKHSLLPIKKIDATHFWVSVGTCLAIDTAMSPIPIGGASTQKLIIFSNQSSMNMSTAVRFGPCLCSRDLRSQSRRQFLGRCSSVD